jgi:hypothetical protein
VPLPNQLPKMSFPGIDPGMQKWLDQLCDTVNTHSGYNGPPKFADSLDLGGNRILNLGEAVDPTDALSSIVAEGKYSAAVLKPQLSPGSKNSMPAYRQINSQSQREQVSSWLNDLMSAPPTANNVSPLTSATLTVGIVTNTTLGSGGTSGYTTASGLPTTTSGSGTGATASITAAGGIVTGGSAAGGHGYSIGDQIFPTQAGSSGDAYFVVAGVTNTGNVSVTIPAGLFYFADGSSTYFESRTDVLSIPASYPINTIAASGGIVTVTTFAPTGLSANESMSIVGVSPAGFNGVFPVQSATPPHTLTYQDDIANGSGSGGSVQVNNCYYYALRKRKNVLNLLGPFANDTLQNRLTAGYDGFQIVAVVLVTNTGNNLSLSGGGASPTIGSPTAGGFF